MVRSPDDIALLLDAIAGPDPRQPDGLPAEPIGPVREAALKGLRIGWLADWGGAFPMEAGVLDLCETALAVFREAGAEVEPVASPFNAEAMFQSWATLRSRSMSAGIAALEKQGAEIKDTAVWEIECGLAMSALEVPEASVVRSDWFKTAHEAFLPFDALVLPTAQTWPFFVDLPYPTEIAGISMDTYRRWLQVMVPVSSIGLTTLAIPAGFSDRGLTMGIQIFGVRGRDRALFEIGARIARAHDGHKHA